MGLSEDLDAAENHRRTVYGKVSRGRLNTVLALYDFPDPTMTAPQRELTTSPLQQLFVMNSPFIQSQAEALVKRVEPSKPPDARSVPLIPLVAAPVPVDPAPLPAKAPDATPTGGKTAGATDDAPDGTLMVRAMYRRVLARDPSAKELDLAASYLKGSTLQQYAQALLSSSEVIFWP
jgi:hypothetical protein